MQGTVDFQSNIQAIGHAVCVVGWPRHHNYNCASVAAARKLDAANLRGALGKYSRELGTTTVLTAVV